MTQIFNEDGTLTPVTVLQAGPCVVTQIKTAENDGYDAVQVGFVDKKDKIVNKDKTVRKRSFTVTDLQRLSRTFRKSRRIRKEICKRVQI